MRIIDISQPLRAGMPVWPGDRGFEPAWSARKTEGSSVNVGAVAMSLHTGTHADAPLHVDDDGAAINHLDPSLYVGPAEVIEWIGSGPIPADVLDGARSARLERLLIKTRVTPPPESWQDDFAYLSVDLARRLVDDEVKLVGIDTPSIDHPQSKDLDAHHMLFSHGVVNLENLHLSHVEPGKYVLLAVPVIIEGMDAGPVRAVLIRPDDFDQSLM